MKNCLWLAIVAMMAAPGCFATAPFEREVTVELTKFEGPVRHCRLIHGKVVDKCVIVGQEAQGEVFVIRTNLFLKDGSRLALVRGTKEYRLDSRMRVGDLVDIFYPVDDAKPGFTDLSAGMISIVPDNERSMPY
jgi:hypothetical protein